MNENYALKSHSQLKEFRADPQKLFDKRVGHKDENLQGGETPIGHTYSVILEELANEKLDSYPDAKGFLEFLNKNKPYCQREYTLQYPTWVSDVFWLVVKYMEQKGLSSERQKRVINEIVGPNCVY